MTINIKDYNQSYAYDETMELPIKLVLNTLSAISIEYNTKGNYRLSNALDGLTELYNEAGNQDMTAKQFYLSIKHNSMDSVVYDEWVQDIDMLQGEINEDVEDMFNYLFNQLIK